MMNRYGFERRQRPASPGIELHELLGWGLCGIAVTYMFAVALLGLLAR